MPRPITHADFEAVFRQYADKAIKRFNMTGDHPPQLYCVKLGEQPGQLERTSSLNKMMPTLFQDERGKQVFSMMLRDLLTPGSVLRTVAQDADFVVPDMVVQINEAWWAQDKFEPGTDAKSPRASDRTPPSERPDRKEVILIAMHTTSFSTLGTCWIVDHPRRHAMLGMKPEEDAVMTGRMSMTQD